MKETIRPQNGDIAICSLGHVGVVQCDVPSEVQYPGGRTGMAWTGMKLAPNNGTPWNSRNPRIIARQNANGVYEPVS